MLAGLADVGLACRGIGYASSCDLGTKVLQRSADVALFAFSCKLCLTI
jgi:hypothetical protein